MFNDSLRVHTILAQVFYNMCDYCDIHSMGEVLFYRLHSYRAIMIGHVAGQPLHPLRRILTKKPGQYLPRLLIFFSNIWWIKVERPVVDYSKFLGPDWKPTYEGTSTYVVNHSAWMVSSF